MVPATPPTLADIAELSGVSISSASRAMSGRGDLSDATRVRVLAAADALGYRRDATARGRPRRPDTRLVELVLGGFHSAWTDATTRGARDAAFRLGFDLALTLERDDPDDDWPERVATRRPTGIVLGLITPTSRQLDRLRELAIPIVLLDPRSEVGADLPSVGTTDRQGGYDAGRHLVEHGFDRYVVVGGIPRFRFGRAREEGFRQAVADAQPGAVVDRVASTWTRPEPTSALREALGSGGERVGVFAVTDEMAFAVYRAAEIAGRRIPVDVGVVGFDDQPRAARVDPPLTSVRQPLAGMAARAVELVVAAASGEDRGHERVELPAQLVVRRSSMRALPPPAPIRGRLEP